MCKIEGMKNIRNFAIIAHIDHGKSTLADRLLEETHTLDKKREMMAQVLDSMELEREHGITIKAHSIRMKYQAKDGQNYILNLIDTPGHVDFTYEVSRSLAATEGVLLLVDASQGIEAQTLAHTYEARRQGKLIIPVINKIDLPAADITHLTDQLVNMLEVEENEIILASAKEGIGTKEILEAIVERIPPPSGKIDAPLRALIFDSWFDPYRGAVIYARIFDGQLSSKDEIMLMSSHKKFQAQEVGTFRLKLISKQSLSAGEVGYIIAGIKNVADTKIGDTITLASDPAKESLPGAKLLQPMVFCSLYPTNQTDYNSLRDQIAKLHLNDSSWIFEPESSKALGFGFRCGFLGLLHSQIIQERLEREYDLEIIATTPSVSYKITMKNGEVQKVDNPTHFPSRETIERMEEPYILAKIITPASYLGPVLKLAQSRRGIQKKLEYIDIDRVLLTYEFPLSEIIRDFYDRLKSASSGYASFDYDPLDYREVELAKLDILLAGEIVDALSCLVPKERAYPVGKELVTRLKEVIPRQNFVIPVQAAIGGKIIARETISAYRKDVIAKLYGGDVTRKRKLLEKQKAGKRRMKKMGKVFVPQEAFRAILKVE